ncbi:MAG: hypothetical protein IJX28_09105 [Clostridia bacterium]|nr:hypothetical protein [Clostridia bacterium]
MFLLKRQRAMERLFAEGELPGTIQLRQGATVLLRASLWETKDLQKLALKRSGHLPLQFPLGAYQEWMDTELNCLLYKGKFPLLFTSFEIPVLLYPKEIIEKLLRIRDAAFQFNYRALSEPTTRNLLRRLLKQGSPVLLGTGVNNTEQARYYELTYALKCAENELTPSEFQALLEWNQSFWKC